MITGTGILISICIASDGSHQWKYEPDMEEPHSMDEII
jgi:hypothetical protein